MLFRSRLIESKWIHLHQHDGESVLEWVVWLCKEDAILTFKSGGDPAPADSTLADNAFVLIIQSAFQKKVFKKNGHAFAGLDVTYNTTHYENMSLFTVIVQDRWGHGMLPFLAIYS